MKFAPMEQSPQRVDIIRPAAATNGPHVIENVDENGNSNQQQVQIFTDPERRFIYMINKLKRELNYVGNQRGVPILQKHHLTTHWDAMALLHHILSTPQKEYKWQDYFLRDILVSSLSIVLYKHFANPNDVAFEAGATHHMICTVIKTKDCSYYNKMAGRVLALLVPYVLLTMTTAEDREKFATITHQKDAIGIFNKHKIHSTTSFFRDKNNIHSKIHAKTQLFPRAAHGKGLLRRSLQQCHHGEYAAVGGRTILWLIKYCARLTQWAVGPRIVTIRFRVPGTYSPRWLIRILVFECIWSSFKVLPPRPKIDPIKESGTNT